MKAIWKDTVIAESSDTVVVENNHYFPLAAVVNAGFLEPSSTTTVCGWKGTANYYNLKVGGDTNVDAVWYYAEPKPAAVQIKGRVAFWKGVRVVA